MTVTNPLPKSAAERKRDRAALVAGEVPMADLTTSALVDCLPALMSGRHSQTLALVLCELGRRGGVTVTTASAAP